MMHLRLDRALILTVALLVVVGAQASRVRALDPVTDAPSDVPGALWSGGSISSSVGGAVVDRVWRIELAEGRVAILNLTGSAGSELGLYLFDEFAGSVTTDVPIAQSAKAGGNQQLTATLQAGTYFVDVNGRNTNRAYAFTLSILLLADTTPPSLSLRPVPGGAAVNTGSASVEVLASDLLSGVTSMRFRVDGGDWDEWQPSRYVAELSIPEEPGAHKIEGQVTNGLGLISRIAATSIVFDAVRPTATRTAPRADGSTLAARPTIVYVFSEPMRASSWTSGGLVVLSRGGGVVPGTLSYDAATRTGRWTATDALLLGEPYAVQLGTVVDLAGNQPVESPAWVLQYQLAAKIAVDATPVNTTYLALRTMIGTLANIPVGANVLLEQRLPGGEWVEHSRVSVVSGAPLRTTFRPTQTSEWRLRYEGDNSHRAAVSTSVAVRVSAKLTLSGAGGYVRLRTVGATVRIFGTAAPASSSLTLVRYRCNSLFTGCVVAARIPVTADESGAITHTWKATRGYWIWKLKSAAGGGLEAGTTGRLRFTVR